MNTATQCSSLAPASASQITFASNETLGAETATNILQKPGKIEEESQSLADFPAERNRIGMELAVGRRSPWMIAGDVIKEHCGGCDFASAAMARSTGEINIRPRQASDRTPRPAPRPWHLPANDHSAIITVSSIGEHKKDVIFCLGNMYISETKRHLNNTRLKRCHYHAPVSKGEH